MEEQLGDFKGIDPGKMKRTCIIIYTLYYIYNIFFKLLLLICGEIFGSDDDDSTDEVLGDLIASYFPYLLSNPSYVPWIKFKNIFVQLVFGVFCPLIDIVPAMVYYHAARMVEGMKWEIGELGTNDSSPSNSNKSEIMYSLWSRFEALAEMVGRADKLFGAMVVLCQGNLFTMICCIVYFFMKTIMDNSIKEFQIATEALLFCILIFQPIRLLLSISLMSKLEGSSSELISTTALFFNKRLHFSDKEEQKVVRYFLNRLNQIKLTACPSGFYKIKPHIYLTMLSLIVTYTVILMQSN